MSASQTPDGRSDYLDRLRVVLTALVILHHTAITYGASGGWFYRELAPGPSLSSQLLTLFCAVNQAYFMGFFFLLAGRFTPTSLKDKGPGDFLKNRLLRMGIPLLVFGLVLGPLTVAIATAAQSGSPGTAARWVIGPLWFAWALLLLSLGYVVWHALRDQADTPPPAMRLSLGSWALSAIFVGLTAWLIRQWVPVGESVLGLQLGYFASYVFLFALGCTAADRGGFEQLNWGLVRPWLVVSLLAIPLLPLLLVLAERWSPGTQNVNGGWNASSLIYAAWEPWLAWGVIAALLVWFRERFNRPHPHWSRWSREAYGAFVLHAPITVAVAVAVAGWSAPALLKFVLVGSASIVLSFGAARALRYWPPAQRLL